MFLNCLGFCRSNSKHTSSSRRHYPTVIEEFCHRFSLADLRKSTNNFDQNCLIGLGGFGKVYKGCLQHNGPPDYTVAMRRFNLENSQAREEFKTEIELLCQLRHPNIISLTGFCDDENENILVYEYLSNGSLDRHLKGGELSWKKRLEILIGAARGLHYLHAGAKRTIIHRDVKPSNILLDHNMEPKLVDFGLSIQGARSMSKPKPIQVDRLNGTYGYIAVEYLMHGTITDRCDVYSFGMVLQEFVWGRILSDMIGRVEIRENPVENIDLNIKGKIAPKCWQVFIDIMIRCLKEEPDERPTMGEVEGELEHALSLQEQADITNTNGNYTLFSTTIIHREDELVDSDTDY